MILRMGQGPCSQGQGRVPLMLKDVHRRKPIMIVLPTYCREPGRRRGPSPSRRFAFGKD